MSSVWRSGAPKPLGIRSLLPRKAIVKVAPAVYGDLPREEGPSCIFVGPIDTASKETLEALYVQARDSYYSGKPLIIDDMFDRVELKLRQFGSKSVVKYPRCSLKRQYTYADAEEDTSQTMALASIWILLLAVGSAASSLPLLYFGLADHESLGLYRLHGAAIPTTANGVLFAVVGAMIGYPVSSSSVNVLRSLWRNELVALKGACPNCGEEVFAFLNSDPSKMTRHRSDCHVCGCLLEFRVKCEKANSKTDRLWVYGRIYLISRRRR